MEIVAILPQPHQPGSIPTGQPRYTYLPRYLGTYLPSRRTESTPPTVTTAPLPTKRSESDSHHGGSPSPTGQGEYVHCCLRVLKLGGNDRRLPLPSACRGEARTSSRSAFAGYRLNARPATFGSGPWRRTWRWCNGPCAWRRITRSSRSGLSLSRRGASPSLMSYAHPLIKRAFQLDASPFNTTSDS